MKTLKEYLKYYSLENYLFDEISNNFAKKQFLTLEEFLVIVIWKSNRSKTRVLNGIKETGKTTEQITAELHKETDPAKKMEMLLKIRGIGIPVASAILSVCYPDNFTVLDYRSLEALSKLGVWQTTNKPQGSIKKYFEYLEVCKKMSVDEQLSLRDTDRALWGFSFYEGENGLKELGTKIK